MRILHEGRATANLARGAADAYAARHQQAVALLMCSFTLTFIVDDRGYGHTTMRCPGGEPIAT